jgi:hypothetical protein
MWQAALSLQPVIRIANMVVAAQAAQGLSVHHTDCKNQKQSFQNHLGRDSGRM